jgi:tRNA pseudouridine55 synthase
MDYDFYNGEVLLIDKPYTWSSFQAVNKIRYAIKNHPSLLVDGAKVRPKVGHAGTLDPLATGLLIICTGKKTRTINTMMEMEKEYTGTFFIGATTPSYDLEKAVDKEYPTSHITAAMLQQAARELTGSIQQVPPVFSAVLVDGKRAYELARAGIETELKAREIHIREFELINTDLPSIDFRIVCSKGTYIRSIARDLGLALGSGAYLTKLRRTRIGNFKVEDAVTPQEFSGKVSA